MNLSWLRSTVLTVINLFKLLLLFKNKLQRNPSVMFYKDKKIWKKSKIIFFFRLLKFWTKYSNDLSLIDQWSFIFIYGRIMQWGDISIGKLQWLKSTCTNPVIIHDLNLIHLFSLLFFPCVGVFYFLKYKFLSKHILRWFFRCALSSLGPATKMAK